MANPSMQPDPAEPEMYWSGHSGWATLPGVVVGGIVSAAIMLGIRPLSDWVHLRADWMTFVCFWAILFGWTLMAITWTYRAASYQYQLTHTHLFVDFGMLFRPVPSIPLVQVLDVRCRAWALRRLFGVGSVVIIREKQPAVKLRGIFRPERFAEVIQKAVKHARNT